MRRFVEVALHKTDVLHLKGTPDQATITAISKMLKDQEVKTYPARLSTDTFQEWLKQNTQLKLVRHEWNLNGTEFLKFEVVQ